MLSIASLDVDMEAARRSRTSASEADMASTVSVSENKTFTQLSFGILSIEHDNMHTSFGLL